MADIEATTGTSVPRLLAPAEGGALRERLLDSDRAPRISAALEDVVAGPVDAEMLKLLQTQVRLALAKDPRLAADVERLIDPAGGPRVAVTGSRGVQTGDHNTQTNRFGWERRAKTVIRDARKRQARHGES